MRQGINLKSDPPSPQRAFYKDKVFENSILREKFFAKSAI